MVGVGLVVGGCVGGVLGGGGCVVGGGGGWVGGSKSYTKTVNKRRKGGEKKGAIEFARKTTCKRRGEGGRKVRLPLRSYQKKREERQLTSRRKPNSSSLTENW